MTMRNVLLVGLVFLLPVIWFIHEPGVKDAPPTPGASTTAASTFGHVPLHFERNVGQVDDAVRYIAQGAGYSMMLADRRAVIALGRADSRSIVSMGFAGSHPAPEIEPEGLLEGKTNYLTGGDQRDWKTNIDNYERVRYKNIYDGVDALFYGDQQNLEFDLVVQPNIATDTIALDFAGADNVEVNADGDLMLEVDGAVLKQHKPVVYQEIDGTRKEIASNYVLTDSPDALTSRVTFQIGEYDRSRTLTIDPVLAYSTFWGGPPGTGGFNIGERGAGIAVDSSGSAYIVGTTTSNMFPTVNPLQTQLTGAAAAFVAKLNPTGTGFVYSTYLNGTAVPGGNTLGAAIAVNSAGNAFVTGITQACNFPTTPGAFLPAGAGCGGGNFKGFLSKLNTTGNGLDYSTYIGDPAFGFNGEMRGVAVDSSNNAYVTGFNTVSTFPTTAGAFRPAPVPGSGSDVFVMKFNSGGTGLVYSTFLGGGNTNPADAFGLQASQSFSIALDSSNNAVVSGFTTATNFPVTPGAPQAQYAGFLDAFVTKLNPTGTAQIFSTYLGGGGRDGEPVNVAVDAANNVFVATNTQSPNFPVTATSFQPFMNGSVGATALTKLTPLGSMVYSTFIGFSTASTLYTSNVAVDAGGNAYLAGNGPTSIFPVNPVTLGITPSQVNFVGKFNSTGTGMAFGTYLNGTTGNVSAIYDIAVDSGGNAYMTGATAETGFPITAGAPQSTNLNTNLGNAFVSKIGLTGTECPSITINPQPLRVGLWHRPYSQQLTAAGGTAPYSFSVYPGFGSQLPNGITLSGGGLLSGTYLGVPIANSVAIRATDASGCVGVRPYRQKFLYGTRPLDFDGDLKSDISIFRPSNGNWYRLDSFRNIPFQATQFGLNGDIPAAGDFDGDGIYDTSVFRPSSGTWYRIESLTGNFIGVQFGAAGDLPVIGDYDGDGITDIAIFRPSNGVWYMLRSQAGLNFVQFGANGDRPVAGDYDGDGQTDICVFRPSTGAWYRLNSSNGQFVATSFGTNGDIPVRGDFNAGGQADVAVFRPSNGTWYFTYSENGQFGAFQFGSAGDVPVPSDYDGDSASDFAVWRPSTGVWYIIRSFTGSFYAVQFGSSGDVPIAALP